jgi:hypothetical protein
VNCPHCSRTLAIYRDFYGRARCQLCFIDAPGELGEPDVARHNDLAPMVVHTAPPVRPSDDGFYDRVAEPTQIASFEC